MVTWLVVSPLAYLLVGLLLFKLAIGNETFVELYRYESFFLVVLWPCAIRIFWITHRLRNNERRLKRIMRRLSEIGAQRRELEEMIDQDGSDP
ncbi:MAG TPA: hypothetical protein VI794_00925 [Patescibacteria group bacterium]|nr:hypothetical protein [Patescibacteria group bacterium]